MCIACVLAQSCIVIEGSSLFHGTAPLQTVETKLSLDALLQMTGAQVRDTLRRLGFSSEDCARLGAALSCLKSATESGMCLLHWSLYCQMHHFVFSFGLLMVVRVFSVFSGAQEVN